MKSRIRRVLDEALDFVLVRSAVGVGLGVVGGLVGAVATRHHKADSIALAACGTMVVVGAVAILVATYLDPMGTEAEGEMSGVRAGGFWYGGLGQGGTPAIEHWNDALYASGVVIIAVGVLVGVVFSLAGASPITPLRSMH